MVDAVIIGGGPAGIVGAIALRREGLQVVLADAVTPPIDKACGEGLMPDARAALDRLDVSIPSTAGFPFRGIRFVDGARRVDSNFSTGCGIGVRRTTLHRLLVEQAEAAGVEMRWGARVTGISAGSVCINGAEVATRWIIGADGAASRVRAWAGLQASSHETRRFGFRRHYRLAPWTRCMEIHWGPGHQIYVTPIAPDEVCVALISRDSRLRLDQALANFPGLAERLRSAEISSDERGSAVISRRLRRVCSGNVALIGDASGSVDAITGEGLSLAFHQAASLARALVSSDLRRYQAEHRTLFRRPAFMAGLMLLLGDCPHPRSRAMRVLAARPHLFERMLAMHVGQLHPARFAATGVSLGARMLFRLTPEREKLCT